ncbi:MAG TPA: DUF4129 domain-containing protein [Chloroflexota bacterium]|nr:DUF4129 domain-containing protein [Chloroflexota bacterium]
MERRWLPVCFLLMQAAWASALAEVVSARFGGHGLLLTLPVAAVTLFAGYAAGRRFLAREVAVIDVESATDRSTRESRAAPLGVLLLGMAWSFGAVWLSRHGGQGAVWVEALPGAAYLVWGAPLADAFALALAFALWWHGQRVGQTAPEHDSTVRAFGIGSLVFAAALLWSAGVALPPAGLPLAVLLFLGAGLPALSLARLKEVRRDLLGNVARGEPASLDAAWWRTLAPPVAGIIATALVAALLFSDAAWRAALLAGMGVAGQGLVAVLYVPLLLMGHLAEWLIFVLRQLYRPAEQQPAPPPAPGGGELLRDLQLLINAPELPESTRWAVWALVAALALAAYLLSSRVVRRAREAGSAGSVDRESLSSWRLLLSDLRAAWRALLNRLRSAAIGSAVLPSAGVDPPSAEARDAREAYRALLALGRAHAVPRRAHQTPDEYLSTWRAALPAEAEAHELTGAYARARYGPPEPPPVPVSRLQALVLRIREALTTPRPRA